MMWALETLDHGRQSRFEGTFRAQGLGGEEENEEEYPNRVHEVPVYADHVDGCLRRDDSPLAKSHEQ